MKSILHQLCIRYSLCETSTPISSQTFKNPAHHFESYFQYIESTDFILKKGDMTQSQMLYKSRCNGDPIYTQILIPKCITIPLVPPEKKFTLNIFRYGLTSKKVQIFTNFHCHSHFLCRPATVQF